MVGLVTQVLIYAIAAMSLNLILGYGGLVTFGHAAFFGLGGYAVGILYQHFTEHSAFLGLVPGSDALLVVIPAAMLVSAIAAAADWRLSLRTSGVPLHHDHAGVRADGVLPVRLAEGLWRRRRPDDAAARRCCRSSTLGTMRHSTASAWRLPLPGSR